MNLKRGEVKLLTFLCFFFWILAKNVVYLPANNIFYLD